MDFLNNIGATSSSSTHQWKYNVFLSFRGEDTHEGFTRHLYKALDDKGIDTFIGDKLLRGEEISEELIQAMKNSSILVLPSLKTTQSPYGVWMNLLRLLSVQKRTRR